MVRVEEQSHLTLLVCLDQLTQLPQPQVLLLHLVDGGADSEDDGHRRRHRIRIQALRIDDQHDFEYRDSGAERKEGCDGDTVELDGVDDMRHVHAITCRHVGEAEEGTELVGLISERLTGQRREEVGSHEGDADRTLMECEDVEGLWRWGRRRQLDDR